MGQSADVTVERTDGLWIHFKYKYIFTEETKMESQLLHG